MYLCARHDDKQGLGYVQYNYTNYKPWYLVEWWIGHLRGPAAVSLRGKNPRCPLNKRLDGLQGQFKRAVQKKKILLTRP